MRGWVWGVCAVAMVVAAATGWGVSAWGDLRVITEGGEQAAGQVGQSLANPDDPGSETTTTTTNAPEPPTDPSDIPACTIDDQPAGGDPARDWATVMVDTTFAVPADFVPPDLVDVSAAGFGTGDQVREIVVPDLDALRQAAAAAGTPVSLVSAYRSYDYQQGLFATEAADKGEEAAERTTARAGHSEHQLGTAVDLTDDTGSPLDESFASTPTAAWLAAHAHEFGFVVSYPDVPPARSCYQYEPWHLRYIGHDLAATVHESGLTLREWLLTHR